MARTRTSYVCGACGARTPQWQGQCPGCEAWNTLEARPHRRRGAAARVPRERAAVPRRQQNGDGGHGGNRRRARPRGIGEFDRVLGGGLVAGSVVLLGGDPGIGKSTLLLQAADAL